jgi:hypothetical protein
MGELVFGKDVKLWRTQLIATGAWLPESLSMARTRAWNCSNKVFAGCTRNMFLKRRPISRTVIAMLKLRQNLIS